MVALLSMDCSIRLLALRAILKGNVHFNTIKYLLNPIDLWRCKEFVYAYRNIALTNGAPLLNKGALVLDISSPKMFSLYLNKQNKNKDIAMEVTDISDSFVNEFRLFQRLTKCEANVAVRIADARQLPYRDNTFDLIYSISVFEHIDKDGDVAAIKECERVLKNHGYLIITVPFVDKYQEKYIDYEIYTKKKLDHSVLFSRYYDEESIEVRLLSTHNMKVVNSEFYGQRYDFYSSYLKMPQWSRYLVRMFHGLLSTMFINKIEPHQIKAQGLACFLFQKDQGI